MRRLALLLALGFLALQSLTHARTWTQESSGLTLEGELSQLIGDQIEVNLDSGRTIRIPLKMLIQEDQDFVNEWKLKKFEEGESTTMELGETEIPEGPVVLKLEGVYMDCRESKKAMTAFRGLGGVNVFAKDGLVTIRAESGELAQSAFRSIAGRGFYGKPDHPAFKVVSTAGAEEVEEQSFRSVHICCTGCVRHIQDTIREVPGVKSYDVQQGAREITVKGKFRPIDVVNALNGAGRNATPQ